MISTADANNDGVAGDLGISAATTISRGIDLDVLPTANYAIIVDGTNFNGHDSLPGGQSDDVINGGSGSDGIFGRAGNDTLEGAGDADFIVGGAGDDIIIGGPNGTAFDQMWVGDLGGLGDGGDDVFVFRPGEIGESQADSIAGFEGAGQAGGDLLRFEGFPDDATVLNIASGESYAVIYAQGLGQEFFSLENENGEAEPNLAAGDYIFV